MKKIIRNTFFIGAIILGIFAGQGVVHISTYGYAQVTSYIEEIRTPIGYAEEVGQGGPIVDSVVESQFNVEADPSQRNQKQFIVDEAYRKLDMSGKSYLVADIESGKILISKSVNQKLPIASLTKLMTAVVADEQLGLEAKTTVSSFAIDTYGAQGNLKKGETYSVSELFYPLLLESSNDAAEALAETENRDTFMADLNGKAKSIGLFNTTYEDPSGLSANNISTATDLFKLTQYIHSYRNYIFDITLNKKVELGKKTWFSNSRFQHDDDYAGGKNGYIDEARKTQIALFEHKFDGEKKTIVYIVLKSEDIASDIKELRKFVESHVAYE